MDTPVRPGTRRSRSKQRSQSSSSIHRPTLKRSSSGSSSRKLEVFSGDDEEIPFLKVVLDNSLPIDYFKQDLCSILQAMRIPKWCKLNLVDDKVWKELVIERISGALTNSVYKISYKRFYPLLLRIYGTNAESIIDRDKELQTLAKLSRKNIGPKLLGTFTNGRFEQFLNNSVTLTPVQIRDPKVSRIIARRMKELHLGVQLELEDKINGPTSWSTIDKWISALETICDKISIEDQKSYFLVEFNQIVKFINLYKIKLFQRYNKGLNFFNELVFCHNDTQYGNLLFYSPELDDLLDEIVSRTDTLTLENDLAILKKDITEFDEKLVVIDFEYSGSNVPLYDITNHFCEWMFDYNDSLTSYISDLSKYPTREQRLNFIKSYYKFEGDNDLSNDIAHENIRKLYNDCIYWRPTNCIFWALWAILKKIQSSHVNEVVLEKGPNGEQYLIHELSEDSDDAIEDDNNFSSSNSDDDFDYIKYAGQKISIFLADLIQLGILNKDDIELSDSYLKFLDCEFI